MAMAAGSVSISGGGVVSGTGAARFLYDELIQDYSSPSQPQKVQIAAFCNRLAKLITYIEDNAEITVTIKTTDSGLQRAGGVATDAPATNKAVTGGTIT